MPTRRRSSIVAVVVIAVVVIAIGLGALVHFTVNTATLTAQGALQQYVDAIRTGDLAQADVLVPARRGSPQPVAGAALADPADRITAVSTSIGSSTDAAATGTVRFDLAGVTHSTTLTLARGPAQLGVLPSWRVVTPLTTTIALSVPAAGAAVVNGVAATLGSDLKLTVYPGRYSVGLASDNRWYTSAAVEVDAGTAAATAALTVAPTAALGDEVLAQVKAAIDACVATNTPVPPGCPFAEPAIGTLADFSWRLDSYPQIAFLDPTHVFLEGGQVTADFVLTHSYIVNKQEEDPIAINGSASLTFSGSDPKVTITAH